MAKVDGTKTPKSESAPEQLDVGFVEEQVIGKVVDTSGEVVFTEQTVGSWLDSKIASTEGNLWLVSYRGIWCPYCRSYLADLTKYKEEIEALGGEIIVYTADTPETTKKTKKEWKLPFPVLSDRQNVLAHYLRKNNLINVIITGIGGTEGYAGPYFRKHPRMGKYPNGVVQPSVLVVSNKKEPYFRWRIDPSSMNLGGATDRPKVQEIISITKRKANGELVGKVNADDFANLKLTGMLNLNMRQYCVIL